MRLRDHLFFLIPLLLSSACVQQDSESAAPTQTTRTEQDDEAWAAELAAHREEIDHDLRASTTSPMAGIQYLKSEPGDRVFLTRQEKVFALAESALPETVLLAVREQKIWHWYAQGQEEVTCRVGDEAVLSGDALDGRAICDLGDLFLSVYPTDDRITFTIFDPERPEKKSFDHLLYFPPDRGYAVNAQLVVHKKPEEIEMLTSRDLKKTFYRYAKIKFRLDGKDQELSAFKRDLTGEGSEYLFIPFRDATTSRETYGAGRFLEIEEPDEEHFVLDFNRAFNPLCNYSPAYNCAIPPRENHLRVAIKAGEMTYPH